MIDLRRLQVLRAIRQHGTVTAAAHALHLTPSAASQQVRQLSRDLAVPLLEPVGRRVRLTPAAHTLLRHADILAAQWEEAQADLHAHSGEITGELRLCGFPTGAAVLLAPAAAVLAAEHPRLAVHIAEIEPADAFDLLLSGDTDVAVTEATADCPPRNDPRFDQQPLLDEPMDLLVPDTHPLAAGPAIALTQAADEPWIVGAPDSSYHQLTLAACASAGFAPAVAHSAKEWLTVSALVAHGLGVALVPRLGHIPPEYRVTRVPLRGDPAPTRRILTCTRRGSREQPAVKHALRALHAIAAAHQQPGA